MWLKLHLPQQGLREGTVPRQLPSQPQQFLHSATSHPGLLGAHSFSCTTEKRVVMTNSSVSHFCSKLRPTEIPNQFLPSATCGNIPFPAQEFQFG